MSTKNQDNHQDSQLVILAKKDNQEAFLALYSKYFDSIYRFCYWQTNNSPDAEDLTQDIFIEMAKSIKNFSHQGSFKNWLYVIAKRKINKWIKRKYLLPQVPLFDNLVIDTEDWIDVNNQSFKQKYITSLLQKLKPMHKQVLQLRFLKSYSVKEVAEKLKITEQNVKTITHRALKKLKNIKKV